MSVCNETRQELWQAGPFRRMQDAFVRTSSARPSHACLFRVGAPRGACWAAFMLVRQHALSPHTASFCT